MLQTTTMDTPAQTSSQEPSPKKLKISTATSDGEGCCATTLLDRKPKYKRRKIAIFFGYCGVGYQGMQKNPGAKTIEGDLEEALYLSGAVPEQDRGHPKRFDWSRSARTDKGVSAVGQVISGRFYIDPPGLIDRLHSNLSSQFRIFGFKHVTASFTAQKICDRRRYVYLLPVFALDPGCHRDRESALASLGSETELVKCLECSERGYKVFDVMGKRRFDSESVESIRSDNLSTNETTLMKEEHNHVINGTDQNENGSGKNLINVLHSDLAEVKKVEAEVERSGFCYGERERQRLNRILKSYEGTHNFHNFTTRIKAEDPSAQRFIVSFNAENTVTVDGIEFLKCEVVGQSFMLHQIRKMIGGAVAIMRNCASESLIETALQKDIRITVPTAPEVGLYLDECFFTSYNKKWKDSREEVSMKVYEKEAEEFKMRNIYSHIASTERKGGVVATWLHSLDHRNYRDLINANTAETKSAKTDIIS